MNRQLPYATVCVAAFCLAATYASAAPQPNILLILADDLGYGDQACHGNKVHKTPHIDVLPADGIRFTTFIHPARCVLQLERPR